MADTNKDPPSDPLDRLIRLFGDTPDVRRVLEEALKIPGAAEQLTMEGLEAVMPGLRTDVALGMLLAKAMRNQVTELVAEKVLIHGQASGSAGLVTCKGALLGVLDVLKAMTPSAGVPMARALILMEVNRIFPEEAAPAAPAPAATAATAA